ncbi:MAG: EAL domain-containing protein [Gammaproteobacteria bacterium]|nr:EAL domain-containing protein [Gammaproteobacteria bacterium]
MTNDEISRQTALVVDDDRTMRALMQKSLNSSGIDVLLAENGEEAFDLIRSHPIDIVMLDVELPDTNGFTLCRKIRQYPATEAVPIIMVTAREDSQAIDAAYQAGATDYFAKPINWAILGKRVMLVLGSSRVSADLRRSQSHNQAILNAVPDTLITLSSKEQIIEYRPAPEDRLMPDAEYVGRRSLTQLLPPRLLEKVRSALSEARASGRSVQREFDFSSPSRRVHYELRLAAIESGDYVALLRNITERRQGEEKMRQLAYFDSLTKLPNRQYFHSHFAELLREATLHHQRVACMFVDLDNFKRINDTLGHDAGDTLLKEVANRLTGAVRTTPRDIDRGSDMLSRLGGDEFTILLNDVGDQGNAHVVANRILDLLRKPIDLGEQCVVVTPSIGISFYPEHGESIDELIKAADSAMYKSKELGRNNFQVFDPQMNSDSKQRLLVENRLRDCLDKNSESLFLVYQPQFNPNNRQVVAAEALIRWIDDVLGFVSPADFIPIAEETGLILPLGDFVLRQAIAQISKWQALDFDIPVSVNVSAVQFEQPDIVDRIRNLLFEYRVKPELLTLELTERVIMTDVTKTVEKLMHLKQLGVSISVDDFGTGYSSLAYLKRFPLDELKIDRTFIANIDSDEDDLSIVDAIMAIAKRLKLTIVAEGVESESQLKILQSRDCDLIQGYLLSRPIPSAELTDLLTRQFSRQLKVVSRQSRVLD